MPPRNAPMEDPYRKFFWLLVSGVILMSGAGIGTFVTMRVDGATLRTEMAGLKADVGALKDRSQVYSDAATMLTMISQQVAEMRTALTTLTSDRYSGSQATQDRAANDARFGRLEERMTIIEATTRRDGQFGGAKP